MEKKNSMFKAIVLTIFIALLLTWILPVSSFGSGTVVKGDITPVALTNPFTSFVNTVLPYMGYYAIFILCVGGFYGIMKKSKGYQKAVEAVGNKFKGKEKIFLILSVAFFALLSSLTGMNIELFAFMPLFISIILYLGYDKMSAALATAGGIIMGMIGSTFGTYISGNVSQALNIATSSEMISKIFLLIIGSFLLIMYLYKTAKLSTKKEEKVEDMYYIKESANKKSGAPLLIMLGIVLVFMVIAVVPWDELIEFTGFTKFHTDMMAIELGGFKIFEMIFGALPALGKWNIVFLPIIFLVTSIVVAIIYKIKANDAVEGFFEGVKKVAMPAFLLLLANLVMILINLSSDTAINTITVTMMNFILSLTSGFNLFLSSLATVLGSVFVGDMQYFAGWYAPMFTSLYGNVTLYPLIGLMMQTIYGFMMFVLPVSSVLILGLSYLDIKYLNWLKHIWKFLLELFVVILATLIIVWLI